MLNDALRIDISSLRWLASWLEGGNVRRQFEGRKTLYKSRCDKPELQKTAIEFIANTKDI